jgi:hypothetical protein
VLQPIERRRGVEYQSGLAALIPYQAQRAVDVPARFRVKSNVRGTRPGEIGDDAIDRLDHQVDVDRRIDAVVAERLADERTDRQVRHEMIVHDVEMHDFRAGIEHVSDVLAEPGEVG